MTDLRKSIEKIGSGLYVSLGTPEDLFITLITEKDVVSAYCLKEVASEELKISKAVNNILKRKSS